MSLSPDQVASLASLSEALKGTDLESFVKSLAGQVIKTSSVPAPDVKDSAPAPKDQTEQTKLLSDLQSGTPKSTANASVYLAPHTKNYIQRDVNTTKSKYVPCFLKFFYVLNEMDTVLSDNYYARRALPNFYPTVTRLYYSVLIWYQVLRVMHHNNSLDPEGQAFLTTLENNFPPETLSIAAPLLPFFQSITTSTPENKRFRRHFPAHDLNALSDVTLENRMHDNTVEADWLMPHIPALAYLHHEIIKAFPGTITLGADDSHSAGNKTVTYTPLPGYDTVVDLQHHPRSQYRRSYFPFECHRAQDNTPNATVDPLNLSRISFFGANQDGPYQRLPAEDRRSMTKCGLAEPFVVNKDLTAQFKNNFARINVPEVGADYASETLAALFLMEEDMSWFSDIAGTLSAYATFFPGSGTLGDCSLEGPRVGQYVNRIQAPATLPVTPTYHGQTTIIHQFNSALSTTISEEEEITELLARYTQVNTRMYATHPWIGTLGSDIHRNGPFWDIRPIYTHSTVDEAWIQTPQTIKSAALERPDKRV
uniref:Capsid protein n=10 Tax=Heterobasidion partitivirus 20 TaxID=2025584 RepID=A0A2P1G1Y9_9VIRU|nr:capsid protein [Heterobasidion partitivirus 20]